MSGRGLGVATHDESKPDALDGERTLTSNFRQKFHFFMKFSRKKYSTKHSYSLYESLLRPRLIEEKMLILLRQNKTQANGFKADWSGRQSQWGITAALGGWTRIHFTDAPATLGVFNGRQLPCSKRLFAHGKEP